MKPLPLAALCLLLPLLPARAETTPHWTAGHGDLRVIFDLGTRSFTPVWHLDPPAIVDGAPVSTLPSGIFAPADLRPYLETQAAVYGIFHEALGVASDATVYETGHADYPPDLGFHLQDTDVDIAEHWEDEIITISLTNWSTENPGEAIFFQKGSGELAPLLLFSTLRADLTNFDNQWLFGANDHQHLSVQFSAPGYYELEFTWEGIYLGDGSGDTITGSAWFGFQVTAIPEPGTYALLATGLLLVLRRKRKA